ncbi:MAG: hypothetical protein ACX931_14405 [Saccharospirillum sp.]
MPTLNKLLLLCISLLLQACTWTVIPPEPTANTATVYLSVYGRHTRLALPDGPGQLVEYGFGDWRYYAEAERTLFTGAQALFFSSGATLSRRELTHPNTTDLSRHFLSVRTESIDVPAALASQLHEELLQGWEAAAGEEVRQGALVFRRSPQGYSLFHNSNHQTAEWLERLQCEVLGVPVWSTFEVAFPGEP